MSKTVKINLIKDTANRMLKDSPNDSVDYRQGIISVMDAILMETKNYRGFRYLDAGDVAPGYSVGVHIDKETHVHDFENTDRTRIQFA